VYRSPLHTPVLFLFGRALHTRPLPTTVASPVCGILDVHKSKSYDGAYVQMGRVTFLSANPEKDSKWGRKTRAGGCITFINKGIEGTARTYQYCCTAIESVGSTGACTVSKQGFFTVTDQGRCAICPFNSGDLSRTVADPGQQDEDGRPVKKSKPNGKGGPVCVENAKTGRAKCRECGETIGKGGLRFGTENNFRGNLTMEWRHADCLPVDLSEAQLTALTGWDTLSAQVWRSLALAVARAPQHAARGVFIYSSTL